MSATTDTDITTDQPIPRPAFIAAGISEANYRRLISAVHTLGIPHNEPMPIRLVVERCGAGQTSANRAKLIARRFNPGDWPWPDAPRGGIDPTAAGRNPTVEEIAEACRELRETRPVPRWGQSPPVVIPGADRAGECWDHEGARSHLAVIRR